MNFTHLNSEGKASMVDVSSKNKVKRRALAAGKIFLKPETLEQLADNKIAKGDVLTVAKIAGITGAKNTSTLIPLCHNIAIEHIDISFKTGPDFIEILAEAKTSDKTGIEMEALTAVTTAALTIYDMCKAVDKEMRISDIKLIEKEKN